MTDTWTLPAETTVGRVALRVADLDALVGFYETVVGLTVRTREADRAVLGTDRTPLVELHETPDRPARDPPDAGLFHAAVRVPTRGALGEALARIEDRWRLTGASDHRVSEALYLRDPEDNGVEIYCDRPRQEWPEQDGRVRMATLGLDLEALRAARADAFVETVPPGTDLGHVHLEVTALDRARRFYVDRLGLTVRQESEGAVFLAAGDYHHHVGLNTWNGRSSPATGRGIEWVELRVPADALADLRERLGADADVVDTDDGFAVEDPDGIGVRLTPYSV